MLKRRDRIERLDKAIAETEVAITEQLLLIVHAEGEGRSTTVARQLVKTLESILVEYMRARKAIVEAKRLTDGDPIMR